MVHADAESGTCRPVTNATASRAGIVPSNHPALPAMPVKRAGVKDRRMPTATLRSNRMALRCERCHGPGSLHIEGKGKMVNPAKLEPARRDSVCSQCHLSGEARVERAGRKLADYRPGRPSVGLRRLLRCRGLGRPAGEQSRREALEERLQTRCRAIACGAAPATIPTAYRPPPSEPAWFRARCLTCHEPADCERGFDCVACHMPKSPAADAGHGVFTDHSIPRVPRPDSDEDRTLVAAPRLFRRR